MHGSTAAPAGAHPQRLQLSPRLAQLLLQLRYLGHGVVLRILQLLRQLCGMRDEAPSLSRGRHPPRVGFASAAPAPAPTSHLADVLLQLLHVLQHGRLGL